MGIVTYKESVERIEESARKEWEQLPAHIQQEILADAKKLSSPTSAAQAIIDILNVNQADKQVLRAGGGPLIVREDRLNEFITVETEFHRNETGQADQVQRAMEKVARLLRNHHVSCTLETDYARCPCPAKVTLECSPPRSR